MVGDGAQADAATNTTSESARPIESNDGDAQRVPSTKRQRATDCHASVAQPGSLSNDAMLAFISNIKDLLHPIDLRPLLTCNKATSLPNMLGYITNMTKAAWTENDPICSSPFCTARTGFWLPSEEEITKLTKRGHHAPFEYMCAEHDWGSVTLRSVIKNMEDGAERAWDRHGQVRTGGRALVACSLHCGKVLRDIARIQQQHDYVLLASHVRERPNAQRSREFARGRCAIPEKYLLLSEIVTRDASRHGNSRLHDVRAVSGA